MLGGIKNLKISFCVANMNGTVRLMPVKDVSVSLDVSNKDACIAIVVGAGSTRACNSEIVVENGEIISLL